MEIKDLAKVEKECKEKKVPLLGPEKGQWLLDLIKSFKPERILELGTGLGYATLILGSEGAEVTTIEIDIKRAEQAIENFKEHKIKFNQLAGDANEVIKKLLENRQQYDLIFMDHRKKGYLTALDACYQLMPRGGMLIADNITLPEVDTFKLVVESNPKFKTQIINIKDGLSFSQKVQ